MTYDPRFVEPLPDVSASASVIVIGAGIAGLCAALELKARGCRVRILEARHRAGGRIRTRRNFPENLYIEEGATRFPIVHHYTMHYLEKFELPLVTFNRPDMGDTLHIMGRHVESTPDGQDPWPPALDLHPHERAMSLSELTSYYLDPLLTEIGDPLAPQWPSQELVDRFDGIGYADLLRSRGASEGAIRALALGFHVGEGPNSVSALWWLQAMAIDSGGSGAVKVQGGNDRLVEAFAVQLSEEISFGRPVTAIRQGSHGVTVHVDSPTGPQSLEADYVICTVPLPLVSAIPMSPELPVERRQAFASIPYATLSRVALQCRTRFWLDEGHSGFEHTDESVAEIWDLTTGEPGQRGVLVAYSGGDEARRVTAMSEPERIEYTLEKLEKHMPGVRANFEGGSSICWDEDPWACGGGAWFRPGDLKYRRLVIEPHGRIHFAGEGTSPWPGWVQGSLYSARRAVSDILTAEAVHVS